MKSNAVTRIENEYISTDTESIDIAIDSPKGAIQIQGEPFSSLIPSSPSKSKTAAQVFSTPHNSSINLIRRLPHVTSNTANNSHSISSSSKICYDTFDKTNRNHYNSHAEICSTILNKYDTVELQVPVDTSYMKENEDLNNQSSVYLTVNKNDSKLNNSLLYQNDIKSSHQQSVYESEIHHLQNEINRLVYAIKINVHYFEIIV